MRNVKKIFFVSLFSIGVLLVGLMACTREANNSSNNYLGKTYDESSHEGEFVPGQVIVGMNKDSAIDFALLENNSLFKSDLFSGVKVENIEILAEDNALRQKLLLYLVNNDKPSVIDAIRILEEDPRVAYAEPNFIASVNAAPHPLDKLWGIEKIEARAAWNIATKGHTVEVAVIDTGIDYNHPLLKANVDASRGYDFVTDSDSPSDIDGHGTHVAGIIGSTGNNGNAPLGVSLDVTMIPIKVGITGNLMRRSDIIRGIKHASKLNVPIINFSISSLDYSQAEHEAIKAFNGLFVTAAGNYGQNLDDAPKYPAVLDLKNMIVVGNSNIEDERYQSSNYSKAHVHLFAPGVEIYSTLPDYDDDFMTGTSMATPHVTGAAALALSVNPTLSTEQLKQAILDSVDVIPTLEDYSVTSGRLNVRRLVETVNMD